MTLRKALLAAVVATIVSFPAIASARIVSAVWTCNSDGWEHVVFTYDDGTTQEWITKECGPASPIAVGGGFNLLFSDNTRISERGQAFLDDMETGEILSPRPVSAGDAGTTRTPVRTENIHLRSADVGSRLAAFLTLVDPDWNASPGTLCNECSIFDRWGIMVNGVVLVPGDMGLTIPISTPIEPGLKINAKGACRDRRGTWREEPARQWGCWTN